MGFSFQGSDETLAYVHTHTHTCTDMADMAVMDLRSAGSLFVCDSYHSQYRDEEFVFCQLQMIFFQDMFIYQYQESGTLPLAYIEIKPHLEKALA